MNDKNFIDQYNRINYHGSLYILILVHRLHIPNTYSTHTEEEMKMKCLLYDSIYI